MSAQKRTAGGAVGAFVGFLGMSVVAGLLVTAAVTPAIAVTGMAANDSIGVFEGLPEYLKIEGLAQNSTVYANQGGHPVPIATFYSQNRVEVPWNDIGQVLKDASVSTEDPRFYEHGGIDLMGTIRGALSTYVLHKDVQGGSSITQQYVKNVLVQQCEKLNIIVQESDPAKAKKLQEAQDKKYKDCYYQATETTPDRKLKEMKMAIGLEKKYSKSEILQQYLNIAGFGGQVYGVQSASKYYFNTTAKDINLQQAATLIAILNNPANLRIDQSKADNPDNNAENGFKETLDRRNYVLDRMYVNHKITAKQRDDAKATKIEPAITPLANGCSQAAAVNAAFYCDWVQHLIENDKALGKTAADRDALLRRGGLQIYTPLNLDIQATAQQSLSSVVDPTHPGVDLGGANVDMELGTGRVVAMVQNRPYGDDVAAGQTLINYNTDYDQGGSGGFQTGSTYKLFTLLEWLKEGRSLNDIINAPNNETTFAGSRFHSTCDSGFSSWLVGNDAGGEGGNQTVLHATAESVNTAFAVMGTKLDLCGIKKTAQSLGVHLAWPYQYNDAGNLVPRELGGNPASILGTNELSPLTMAAAYATVGNNGVYCSPVGIDKIVDSTGKELPVTKTTCTQALDPNVAAGAAKALQAVVNGGTGNRANPHDGTPLLGKTGTTDHAAQNWFVSSTTKVATATWVGNVQKMPGAADFTNFGNLSLNGTYGRDAKLVVARPIIAALDALYGGDAFPQPSGSAVNTKQITVPDLTGQSPAQAQSTLEDLGFTYQDGGPVDSAAPSGTVASTDPAGGSTAGVGATVTVYTSNGSLTALPDVTGKKVSDAIKTLSAAGFGAVGDVKDPNAIVTATDPAPGTPTKAGTKVKLTAKGGAAPDNNDG
jgi:membrane peptidoglycan carboxypeptidase